MFRQYALVLVSLCALIITGCDSKPTYDSVMEDSLAAMEDSTAILATVKDEASANAAKPKLKEIGDRMKTLKAQQEKIGKPSKEEEAELKKKYEERMTKAFGAMLKETMRLSMDPKLKPALDGLQVTPE
jgi:hypothetical protein